jgi:hypothetical protein
MWLVWMPKPGTVPKTVSRPNGRLDQLTTGRQESFLPHKRRVRRRRKVDPVYALWRFAQEHPDAALSLAEFHEPEPMTPIETEPIKIEELGDSK